MSSDKIEQNSLTSLFGPRAPRNYILDADKFSFAVQNERKRVDRSGSTVAFLLIRIARRKSTPDDMWFLARVLRQRLRATDVAGKLRDGRIGVMLPDTMAEGAWKLAADVSQVYPPGPDRPECEVLTHPDKQSVLQLECVQAGGDAPLVENHGQISSELLFSQGMPVWKRTLDIVGSSLGLLASAPVLLPAVIAISLTSRGSVLFRQQRAGRAGRHFHILKLRTMYVHAERRRQEIRHLSQQDGPAFKMKNDPRITPVGRFLRWSSIDELPQFWNVLVGEMSLVGPRPLPTEESQACEVWHRRRLSVTPGMTCTWQVFGRGRVRFDDWVRMDLRYADRRGLLKDLKLLFITLPSLIFQRGMR